MSVRTWDGVKIYRGPASGSELRPEHTKVLVWINEDTDDLKMQFTIGSRGGRTTIQIVMDREDLLAELEEPGFP